jgi:hypothetical protein
VARIGGQHCSYWLQVWHSSFIISYSISSLYVYCHIFNITISEALGESVEEVIDLTVICEVVHNGTLIIDGKTFRKQGYLYI